MKGPPQHKAGSRHPQSSRTAGEGDSSASAWHPHHGLPLSQPWAGLEGALQLSHGFRKSREPRLLL